MTLFVDSKSKVDREALREYALKKLNQMNQEVTFILTTRDNQNFWNDLHSQILKMDGEEKSELLKVESQIVHLPELIQSWIRMSVESSERFAFFIKSKAEEINSRDEMKDYFWALQIRHDQLIAILRVLDVLIEHMQRWLDMSVVDVLDDGVFLGLEESTIEEQIYLEAEKVKTERDKLI